MKRVFIDTSALIALRDAGDVNHEAAVEWLRQSLAAGSLRLILTNYVLAEVHAFFCRSPKEALAYASKIREDAAFQIVRVTTADETAAWSILEKSQDKTYSFVDAVSFAVMRRLHIPDALAFDAHFKRYGRFQVAP